MLQDFKTISDHFGTLCIKALDRLKNHYSWLFEDTTANKPKFFTNIAGQLVDVIKLRLENAKYF